MDVKQVILIRTDLKDFKGNKVPCGKLMAQVAHASLEAIFNRMNVNIEQLEDYEGTRAVYRELNTTCNSALNMWICGEQKKVCLAVNSQEELDYYYNLAKQNNLMSSYIIDNGHTVFNGIPTPTCVAIGPDFSHLIDTITTKLKLY